MSTYDAIVLGAGMAGIPLAMRLGYKDYKVALIERAELGGTCLNRGCIPTKTLIASAKVAHHAREAERWGVVAENVGVDLAKVIARKDELVASIRAGSERNVEQNENVTLLRGEARFTGDKTLTVNGQQVKGERVFINTGTRSFVPDLQGLDSISYLDSTTALDLRELPTHLLIVGGGYIGVEFAQMFRRFGSDVTLVQRPAQLLPGEDADIAHTLRTLLEGEGITVHTDTEAQRVTQEGDAVHLTVSSDQTLTGSHLMLAAGRSPNTDVLNLAATGVETDAQGFIRINDRLETSAANVWALGDVRGGAMFTHTARDDARVVYQNVVKGESLSIKNRLTPYAVFSDPQLGRVGLNERQAKEAGHRLKLGSYKGKKVAKARTLGEAYGLIKVIADADTNKLLGASVLMPKGAELVHELGAAMQVGARYSDLAAMIHIHPTLSEGLSSALGGVHRAANDSGDQDE